MNKSICRYALLLAFGALFTGGCAKHDMVKKDEGLSAAKTDTPAKPLPVIDQKNQPITKKPVNSQTIDGTAKTAKAASQPGTTLEKIFFNFDSYALSPAARDTLVSNAKMMAKAQGVKIQVEGHCDEQGSDEYNLALGEKRARAAMEYLVTMGVPAEKLSIISYGKEKPADPGRDEAAWAKNRRDEFIIVSK
ncbi:MAG: peptidoglycan-associated lipoprotein Pal [Geobacter sp.]|nr:MAG: peptidoglycan-associated lipoprotein Pal [Geobacter sp.]